MNVCEGLLRKRADNRELLVLVNLTETKSLSTIGVFQNTGFVDREYTTLNTKNIPNPQQNAGGKNHANEIYLMWMAEVQQVNRLKDVLKTVKF